MKDMLTLCDIVVILDQQCLNNPGPVCIFKSSHQHIFIDSKLEQCMGDGERCVVLQVLLKLYSKRIFGC